MEAEGTRSVHTRYCLGPVLLTLTSTTAPARDLGYLLRKHPDRLQSFDLPFGTAQIFYPEATDERCTAAILLDIDPVGLVRGRPSAAESSGLIDAYVNDRPYVASSLLSVAIARVLGAALGGRSDRPELAERELQLEATLSPVRGSGDGLAERLFVPLGYSVVASPVDVDDLARSGSNESLTISATVTLQRLLTHLYVLMPVLDGEKHYWVGDEEAEKLLRFGQDWLPSHPERELIAKRYLKRAPSLARAVVAQLVALDDSIGNEAPAGGSMAQREAALERPLRLQDRRIAAVALALKEAGARSIVDVGCGEGDLLVALARETTIDRLVGVDVSMRELERAKSRLDRTSMTLSRKERIELFQSSVLYFDDRLTGADAVTLLEVIEHVEPSRLSGLAKVLFGETKPKLVIVTTPNREYNVLFPALPDGARRHQDHRFEWTREEFATWADSVASRYDYSVSFEVIGDVHPKYGSPTQMAVFRCA